MVPFQWPWVRLNPDLNVAPLFDAEYPRIGTRCRHSFNKILMGDLEWFSEIFNDTKRRMVSLRQLSFLLRYVTCNIIYRHIGYILMDGANLEVVGLLYLFLFVVCRALYHAKLFKDFSQSVHSDKLNEDQATILSSEIFFLCWSFWANKDVYSVKLPEVIKI